MAERTCRGCRGIINTMTQTHYKRKIGRRRSYYCVSCLRDKISEELKKAVKSVYFRYEMPGAHDYEPAEKEVDDLIAIGFDLMEREYA